LTGVEEFLNAMPHDEAILALYEDLFVLMELAKHCVVTEMSSSSTLSLSFGIVIALLVL
jgi:hypothetical protein